MDGLNSILKLPERCLVNKKITKAFFKRNFDLTNTEKALLDDYNVIKDISWIASVSPVTANIITYKGEQVAFEEVQVISVLTTYIDFESNLQKIAELIQKYIPYAILLCINHAEGFVLNTCDKKVNQNDGSRRTIDKRYFTEILSINDEGDSHQNFLASLNFANLDKTNLQTYYNAYTQRIISLQIAKLNGAFNPRSYSRTKEDLALLEKIEGLKRTIFSLEVQAKKETQLNQRVQLNIAINQKRKEIERLTALI